METQAVVKLGIENLKKVVGLIAILIDVGDAFGNSKGVERWNQLLGLGEAIRLLPGFDFRQVLPEIQDLDTAEREQLRVLFSTKLDLKDDQLEAAIERGLVVAANLVGVIEDAKGLYEEFKKQA